MNSDPKIESGSFPRLDQLVASAQQIKFPAGMFGKTCMAIAIFSVACSAIAWASRDPYVCCLALILAASIAIYGLHRAFNFADKNPSAAILEGAEFVRHQQIVLAAKGHPAITGEDLMPTLPPGSIPRIPAIIDETAPDIPERPEAGVSQ